MLTLAGFLAPYFIAFGAYPLLVGRVTFPWMVPVGTCFLIIWSPWLIPSGSSVLRFLASISAAMLALKVIDVSIDLKKRRLLSWQQYVHFLANPFTHVRRSLVHERRPQLEENLLRLVQGSIGCAIAVATLFGLYIVDWSGIPFLIEHVSKVVSLMLAISSGLTGAAAIWRLGGGTARDFMNKPFAARTPADFWRRYNRNVQQFFRYNVFNGNEGRRKPIRTMLLVFALSALLHELIFLAAVGRVQGYQTAFFVLQGLAAASTARVKVKGWPVVPWMIGTLAFNLLPSVLFFASINGVAPFYSRGLPVWLRGW